MDSEFTEALAIALRKLGARDRFSSEIREALSEFQLEVVDQVIEHLSSKGILNDRRLVQSRLANNDGRRAVGNDLLLQKLVQQGAPEHLVTECLGERSTDEVENAVAALAAKLSPDAPRGKAGRFLVSRGFSEEAVESALDRYLRS